MTRLIFAALALLASACVAQAQDAPAIQPVLQEHRAVIEKSSRTTIGPAIDALAASGLPQAQAVLEAWADKDMWLRLSDGRFYRAEETEKDIYSLTDFDTGDVTLGVDEDDLDQLKPNSGIRAMIATALVRYQIADPDPDKRRDALQSIERNPETAHLAPLRASIPDEPDPEIAAQKRRLERLLTIAHDPDRAARIAAIEEMSGDLGLDLRATLNPLVATTLKIVQGPPPEGENVARVLIPGEEISIDAAYDLLVAQGAPVRLTPDLLRQALSENLENGRVAGVPVGTLGDPRAREAAYAALAARGLVPEARSTAEIAQVLTDYTIYESYAETDPAVTDAARAALAEIDLNVTMNQALDLSLDALSLASIYFLAAIGLAITFGVMGVINMAHGEFIMMGAYTGYVVQTIISDHTVSILVALPLAFAVTFAAGVAMERLVIRFLYNRPLETLLATFGISIALQQLAKTIFGTQARPLTAPGWLDGAFVLNDVVSISYIRIAIFVLALVFLAVFLFIMRRTRLGLETRAVTQNPRMAASMGINPNRVNMLTFGLGSGIAGVAGVAIGLFAKVTSELGSDYIVQSFMTVVVGGVGNIWGTLAGATLIGFAQKGIEALNPSNTLAAQTYMIVLIIIFIQFRPRGLIALRGRAAGD
ncbi:MAG TPA: urea ABC transporter permease subunit UrtB [Rhodobacteraceae bacterium]|nr:urea ABC transporter permease subunit UrtB [Paracoccaceae bacterium]